MSGALRSKAELTDKVVPSARQARSKKYLTEMEEKQLVSLILQIQDDRNGGRITGKEINELIKKKI